MQKMPSRRRGVNQRGVGPGTCGVSTTQELVESVGGLGEVWEACDAGVSRGVNDGVG